MSVDAVQRLREEREFAERHPWDHTAVLIMIGAIWFMTLSGFIPDMLRHIVEKSPPYQTVTHAHAFLAVSWLVLLTVQASFVSRGEVQRHMKVGRVARWTALALLVASVATALAADAAKIADPQFHAERLAFQISHILVFGVLALLAFRSTGQPSRHKRLILMATIALLDAGVTRWIGPQLGPLVGAGPFGQWAIRYPLLLVMLFAIGIYDFATRGRTHPVYWPATGLIAGSQIGSVALYFWPAFGTACAALLKAL